jgi:putative membrane protein
MSFLNNTQKQNIAAAIKSAEARTSGEFVAVIARASDDYYYIPLLWAALLALVLPAIWVALPLPIIDYTLMQFIVFIVAGALFQWLPLKMRVIPAAVKRRRAALLAREQFLAQNLHHTEQRNAILLFVSQAEHYVEIIADKGINDVVADDTWDKIVEAFIQQVQQHKIEQGFLTAIHACGEALALHFPVSAKDVNELPNHLIEID